MDWRKKNVLVARCGISGISAALLLESKGTRVFLYDENEKADTAKIREKLGMDSQAQVLIGALPKEVEDNIELVAVIMGGADSKSRFQDAITLLNSGFACCSLYQDTDPVPLPELPVKGVYSLTGG